MNSQRIYFGIQFGQIFLSDILVRYFQDIFKTVSSLRTEMELEIAMSNSLIFQSRKVESNYFKKYVQNQMIIWWQIKNKKQIA